MARKTGKDTFAGCLERICEKEGWEKPLYTYAFANDLKEACNPLCWEMFGCEVSGLTAEQKEIFRPILIATGCAYRELDKHYWARKVGDSISWDINCHSGNTIHVISDFRFASEAEYFIDLYGHENVKVVEIERIGAPEPTDEEKRNIPECRKYVDYHFTWPTLQTDEERDAKVREFLAESGLDSWMKE